MIQNFCAIVQRAIECEKRIKLLYFPKYDG